MVEPNIRIQYNRVKKSSQEITTQKYKQEYTMNAIPELLLLSRLGLLIQVMLELWGMQSTPSLPLLSGPLRPGIVAPDWALSMGGIELTAYLC